ncbi:hypothetical protein [Paractinoplanes hotanensis]|uniref:Uncharacterized protein n=1 Tax=Paractinoplanes hotanensis TaxID=2906497 RepID=A0ABT0XSH3_9ACTN|nr:hypothetical protein [Actinoplanes hotanensis]MCM4076735.1 hypothetical protein [Actinoplanes hotanensis]
MRFDVMQGIGRHDPAAGPGGQAGVQLDHPLKFMNPNRTEALAPERISQSHLAKIPAGRQWQAPEQRTIPFRKRPR